MSKNIYLERLLSLGGKKNKNIIDYISDDLLIRDKATKIEYTVNKVIIDSETGKPALICYRYYGPEKSNKKVFIKLLEPDFNKFERVWGKNDKVIWRQN